MKILTKHGREQGLHCSNKTAERFKIRVVDDVGHQRKCHEHHSEHHQKLKTKGILS